MAQEPDAVAGGSHERRFPAGSTLFYAGAPARELYLIREGRVRLLKRSRGTERSVGLFGEGDLVGEEALLQGAHRTATAQAIEPVTVLVVDRDTFRSLVRRRPEVGDGVVEQLVVRLRRAEEQIENLRLPDPIIRVLNSLLHALDESPEGPLALSPVELSARTALSLDRVKALVGQLEARGYLALGDQTITVTNVAALRQLHDLLALKEDVRHGLDCR